MPPPTIGFLGIMFLCCPSTRARASRPYASKF